MKKEEKAFLDMIAFAEGTLGVSNNGYDVVVGYSKIVGWTSDTTIVHGHRKWYNSKENSTAAGRYQFTYDTWVDFNSKTNAPMTVENQNKAAIKLINRHIGSLSDYNLNVLSDFKIVIEKLKGRWASFKVRDINKLHEVYIDALTFY